MHWTLCRYPANPYIQAVKQVWLAYAGILKGTRGSVAFDTQRKQTSPTRSQCGSMERIHTSRSTIAQQTQVLGYPRPNWLITPCSAVVNVFLCNSQPGFSATCQQQAIMQLQ
eukprot:GHRR01001555.1.p2 GENE.GHRR01001555.1~~GHRR01001555.1.p2  ORF type:complete len:112 (-),score=14.64 GHRR01001555.1:2094-2429(-)